MLTVDYTKATAKPVQPRHEPDQYEYTPRVGRSGGPECVTESTIDGTEGQNLRTVLTPAKRGVDMNQTSVRPCSAFSALSCAEVSYDSLERNSQASGPKIWPLKVHVSDADQPRYNFPWPQFT